MAKARNNNNIFVIGNGGSAANSSHFAEDMSKGVNDALFQNPLYQSANNNVTKIALKVLSLCDSVPFVSAIANDYSFEDIYLRQLIPFAQKGDLLIMSSVSGTSPNLVKTAKWANSNGLDTCAIAGEKSLTFDDSIFNLANNVKIVINSKEYGIVEDCTSIIFHSIVNYLIDQFS